MATRTLSSGNECVAIVRDDADTNEAPVESGALVADKYRVGSTIATGGMGIIVACTDELLGRPVVLKFLKRRWCKKKEVVERFLREARSAARIRSEHVVRVYDAGKIESGIPYMVMEQLEGEDLESLRRARGPLPIEEAVDMCVQALDAIVEAHEHGIVHRDLKPSNLFLAARRGKAPIIKVLDFGISKIVSEQEPTVHITRTGSMMGSPGYMSPEQVRNMKHVDRRTDVWSLGVILYELLSGENAFTGQTIGEVFTKIREEDLPPLRKVRADAPAKLEAVLRRCLARKRDDRFESASELRQALLPFAAQPMRASRKWHLPIGALVAIALLAWIGWRTLDERPAVVTSQIAVPVPHVSPTVSPPTPHRSGSATASATEMAPRVTPRAAPPKTPRRPPLGI
jgi:serine/threonine-protein kinase